MPTTNNEPPMTLQEFAERVTIIRATPFGLNAWRVVTDLYAPTLPAARLRVLYARWLRSEGIDPRPYIAQPAIETTPFAQLRLWEGS